MQNLALIDFSVILGVSYYSNKPPKILMIAPRPNYGISRIDQPEKRNHGFYVRITHRGSTVQKYFPDQSNGGKDQALLRAQEFRDSIISELPMGKQQQAARPRRATLTSGVTGVTHVVSRDGNGQIRYEYWQGAWTLPDGRRRTRKFSIGRYGQEEALRLAIAAREKALSEGMLP